jgi:hypothetical protein
MSLKGLATHTPFPLAGRMKFVKRWTLMMKFVKRWTLMMKVVKRWTLMMKVVSLYISHPYRA